mgnify:CR=1 FL=1
MTLSPSLSCDVDNDPQALAGGILKPYVEFTIRSKFMQAFGAGLMTHMGDARVRTQPTKTVKRAFNMWRNARVMLRRLPPLSVHYYDPETGETVETQHVIPEPEPAAATSAAAVVPLSTVQMVAPLVALVDKTRLEFGARFSHSDNDYTFKDFDLALGLVRRLVTTGRAKSGDLVRFRKELNTYRTDVCRLRYDKKRQVEDVEDDVSTILRQVYDDFKYCPVCMRAEGESSIQGGWQELHCGRHFMCCECFEMEEARSRPRRVPCPFRCGV